MNNTDLKKNEIDKIKKTIDLNFDARNYFFSKADERWLDLLWENGLLDVIKQKAEDPTRYSYRMPELDYLVRIAEKVPARVVDIIFGVPISTETFNPEVVDRFIWIASNLPADQLARLIPKILSERWTQLMGIFNHWGFEQERMFAKLTEIKDYGSILLLAESVLAIHTKAEAAKNKNGITNENPFIFRDLSYTKTFEYIIGVDDQHLENALKLTTRVMGDIVNLGDPDDDRIFKIGEHFHLFDVDFFTLGLEGEHGSSYRKDIKELAATIKILVTRLLKDKCDEIDFVEKIYDKYIKTLPDSRSMWRLRLYVISLCPKVFKEEIKTQIFRIFDYERPGDLLSGAEYERLVQTSLQTLDESDQKDYVSKVVNWFKKEDWPDSGKDILSSAFNVIEKIYSPDEISEIEKTFGPLNKDYEPRASVSMDMSRGGIISSSKPGTEDQWQKPVPELIELFKTDWSLESLKKNREHDDFFHPRDAEGAREGMKDQMEKRSEEFLTNAGLFFSRNDLDAHYTYSYLRNLADLIQANKIAEDANYTDVIKLIDGIVQSAVKEAFVASKDRSERYWVGDWQSVDMAITDLIRELIKSRDDKFLIDFKSDRDVIFNTIKYLLTSDDPSPKDEELETAKSTTHSHGDQKKVVTDPFTNAINSVRGRAFEALVMFIYPDGKDFPKEDELKLKPDVRALYEEVLLKENTRAMMFMFGHYFPAFYFRGAEWMRENLPKIFSDDPEKRYLYISAWEGYLSNNLYKEMFDDPKIQGLYTRGVGITDTEDSTHKHYKEPDEGIATHLALAFMYYEDFGFDHPLFKLFWERGSISKHSEFVGFIGRMFISGSNQGADELLKTDPKSKGRIKDLWDWLLANNNEPAIFEEFGFWISLEKGIFDPAWLAERLRRTLEKAKGILDWDYGFTKSVKKMAEVAPADVLIIAELYFLEAGIRSGRQRRMPLRVEYEWYEAFKIIFDNPNTKPGIISLINTLIRDGGSTFWNLKDILRGN